MSNKWIKVQVSGDVHSGLRMKAFSVGKKFGDYVVELLSQQTPSGDGTSKDGNLKEVKAVRPSHAGSTPAAGPTEGEVIMKKCDKCFESFAESSLVSVRSNAAKGFSRLCPDCVENIKNGQA